MRMIKTDKEKKNSMEKKPTGKRIVMAFRVLNDWCVGQISEAKSREQFSW